MTNQKRTVQNNEKKIVTSKLSPFELRVRRTIENNGLIDSGDHILIGVSGGADSVALIHCLHRLAPAWQLLLTAAHLDHGIRGEESRKDSDFVHQLAASLEIPYIEESIEIPKLSTPKNLEERAREVRYDFLRRAARTANAGKIAVGHNRNDQAETLLLQLLRGCGISGLSAIRPRSGILIRPLLDMPREDIQEYLESIGIPFREDSSNRSLRHRRNRLRHELIPYLEAWFNPQVIETLSRQADLAREVSDFLDLEAKRIYQSIYTKMPRGIAIPISEIGMLPMAMKKQVLRIALKESRGSLRGITTRHVKAVLRLCDSISGRSTQLPRGFRVIRQFDSLLFTPEKSLEGDRFEYVLPIPGRCWVPEAGMEFTATVGEPASSTDSQSATDRAFLNLESLPAELRIRSRRPGDRIGGPGKRKVKRLLIDAKVPLHERSRLPLVVADNTVIWIPGFKPAKSFIANALSGRCVILEVHRNSSRERDI